MAKSKSLTALEPSLAALAESLGLEFIDAELDKGSGETFLRIFVDEPAGSGRSLSLDACERFHRACLPLVEDVEYDYMECSSPGLDRPLKRERDFVKHMGKRVEVRLFKKRDGRKAFTGTLTGYSGGGFTIDEDGSTLCFEVKETALVKPVIDYDAELSKGESEE